MNHSVRFMVTARATSILQRMINQRYKIVFLWILSIIVVLFFGSVFFRLNSHKILPLASSGNIEFGHSYVSKQMQRDKYVFFVCDGKVLCGGFGDRQKGIVSAYLISLMMKRKFGIWLTKPCNLNTIYDENLVQWDIDPSTLKNLTSREIISTDGAGKKLRERLAKINLLDEYREDVLYFTLNMEFVRFLQQNQIHTAELEWTQHLSVAEIYNIVWRKLFKFKPHLNKQISPFHEIKKRNLTLVGAQIRMGTNPSIPQDSEIRNNAKNLNILWKYYSQYNISSKYRIFITTDSVGVRDTAKKIFPEVFVDIPGSIVHVERSTGKDICQGFQKVILDQTVLSLCDILVISKSGLGRIAAFLRNDENKLFCLNFDKLTRCTTESDQFSNDNW